MSRILFSVWVNIQRIIQGIVQNTTSIFFSVWFRIQGIIKNCPGYYQRLFQYSAYYSGYYSKNDQRIIRHLVQDSAYYLKMSWVLFSVWFSIQGIIQNTTCSVWFKSQRIIKECPGYYSASGSVFRVLFKIRPATSGSGFSVLFRVLFKIRPAYYSASGSGFSVLLKNVQGIIQRLFQYSAYYSGYYSKYDQRIIQRLVQDSAYYLKMSKC